MEAAAAPRTVNWIILLIGDSVSANLLVGMSSHVLMRGSFPFFHKQEVVRYFAYNR